MSFNNYIDPAALSLPSPASDSPASPPPSAPGPSRKRARTDMSAEERKEARAHRNRIAAQNSRDKRKAQFSALESRIAELEEENRQLRAGMGYADLQRADERRREELERELARERENADLKERIKSLETSWQAVINVLAAQGLPPASAAAPPSPSSTNTPTTFPVLVPSSPVFPAFPNPPSAAPLVTHKSSNSIHSSNNNKISNNTSSNSRITNFIEAVEPEPTRHLARVASTAAIPPAVPLQRVDSNWLPALLKTHPSRLSTLPRHPRQQRSYQRTRTRTHSVAAMAAALAQRHQMRLPWTNGSVKSSRALRPCRRRPFLILRMTKTKAPPRPPPRRR